MKPSPRYVVRRRGPKEERDEAAQAFNREDREDRYVVDPGNLWSGGGQIVKGFTAERDRSGTFFDSVEPDWEVFLRAQAFCDELNAGGAARERALRRGGT